MARLIVNPSAGSRREILLSHATILTIGRDPSNDLVLPDAMVSRRHAVIEHRSGQFYLRDCSSANGSVVNGDRVSERSLCDGDLVAIGSARLLFREETSASGKVVLHPSAVPLRCSACGTEYRRGDLFCRQCGKRVAHPSGPPRAVCSSCGTAVPLPARYCSSCGKALVPERERPEQAPILKRGTVPLPPLLPEEAPAPRAKGSMAIAPQQRITEQDPLSDPWRAEEPRDRPALERPASTPAPALIRLIAALVDGVVVLSGQAVMLAPVVWYWWARELPRSAAEVPLVPLLASLTLLPLALMLGVLYHVYFWSVRGATPGQELLDLRVEARDGRSPIRLRQALLRVFGYLLGVASLGVGFLMVAFGGGGLHDRIAGTRVVKVTRR